MTDFFGIPLPALLGQLLLGLVNGSFYAMLSLGLAVIFGMLNIINFAHGALYMMGAFLAWMGLEYLGLNYWVMLLLAPLLMTAAIMIRLDSMGNVIFKQSRRGFNGKPFQIWKFRSMTVAENGHTVTQATKSDARVTRVGRVLRRTSIDELPQLWNVLRGDMSLVGPRPHALAHDNYYDELISKYVYRHHMKPGLTGWAQVNGFRGETPTIDLME